MAKVQAFYDDPDDASNTPKLNVFAVMADGELVPVCYDMTPAGVDWIEGELSTVDDNDTDQIKAIAKDLVKRRPVKFSWTWQQWEMERIANLPARRPNGRYMPQGAR